MQSRLTINARIRDFHIEHETLMDKARKFQFHSHEIPTPEKQRAFETEIDTFFLRKFITQYAQECLVIRNRYVPFLDLVHATIVTAVFVRHAYRREKKALQMSTESGMS